jgi:FlgN protein
MSQWLPVLERHLTELLRLNERLLRLATERAEAMKQRDGRRIEMLLADEHKLGTAIVAEEQKRQMTMIRLGAELGKTPEQMVEATVSEVVSWFGPEAQPLAVLRDKVAGAARRVQTVNQEMSVFAQRMIPHFEELIGILVDGTVGQVNYTAAGHMARSGEQNMNILDVRI